MSESDQEQGTSNSVEAALAGEYELDLGGVLSESWRQTNGIKGAIIGAAVIMYVARFVVMFALGFVVGSIDVGAIGAIIVQIAVICRYSAFHGRHIRDLGQERLPISLSNSRMSSLALVRLCHWC